jgi:hypothetical protein
MNLSSNIFPSTLEILGKCVQMSSAQVWGVNELYMVVQFNKLIQGKALKENFKFHQTPTITEDLLERTYNGECYYLGEN